MACSTFENRILEYVENTAPPAERAAVESHLASCESCRQFALQLREIDADLRSAIKTPALSGEFDERLRRRIQAEAPPLSNRAQRNRKQQLQAEFEAGRSRLRRQVFGAVDLLELLTYAAVGGLIGWMLLELPSALAVILTRFGPQSVDQSLLLPMVAGVFCLFLGLSVVLRQRYGKARAA